MATQTPYEQIKFINDAIKDRQDKNEHTFFSVKVERFGELTPMVNKEPGANFYETILQYLTKYDLTAILIELYHGKSHNIKEPFQQFRILLKKSPAISLGAVNPKEELPVTNAEVVISHEKHFFTMAEKERQVMMLEFELKRLQYENEQLKRKNKKRKNYITELEGEIAKIERDKKNSLGNVSFGMIGANAIESFAKSDFGLGLLKNVFGAKQDMLEGLLGTSKTNEEPKPEIKSTATIISSSKENENLTPEQKVRAGIKKYIVDFLDQAPDTILRLYYELMQMLGTDAETLKSVLGQVKNYREKQKAYIEKKLKDEVTHKKIETDSVNEDDDDEEELDDS